MPCVVTSIASGLKLMLSPRFDLVAFGPILPEVEDPTLHPASRDRIASLEKALCDALRECGYDVLNTVNCRKPLDGELWESVFTSFSSRFPGLKKLDRTSVARRSV